MRAGRGSAASSPTARRVASPALPEAGRSAPAGRRAPWSSSPSSFVSIVLDVRGQQVDDEAGHAARRGHCCGSSARSASRSVVTPTDAGRGRRRLGGRGFVLGPEPVGVTPGLRRYLARGVLEPLQRSRPSLGEIRLVFASCLSHSLVYSLSPVDFNPERHLFKCPPFQSPFPLDCPCPRPGSHRRRTVFLPSSVSVACSLLLANACRPCGRGSRLPTAVGQCAGTLRVCLRRWHTGRWPSHAPVPRCGRGAGAGDFAPMGALGHAWPGRVSVVGCVQHREQDQRPSRRLGVRPCPSGLGLVLVIAGSLTALIVSQRSSARHQRGTGAQLGTIRTHRTRLQSRLSTTSGQPALADLPARPWQRSSLASGRRAGHQVAHAVASSPSR